MAILERIKQLIKEDIVTISDYLSEDLVLFLDTTTQEGALEALVTALDQAGKLKNKTTFYRAILEREKIVSTGIGIGVAIPHAKLAGYEEFFIAIGIQRNVGIPWNSLDGIPVRIIFMIGGPDQQQTEYLNILSMITTAIKEETRRKKLLKAKNTHEVISLFKDI